MTCSCPYHGFYPGGKVRQKLNAVCFLLLSLISLAWSQPNRLTTKTGQKIFSSGMNLAWGNFASDAVNLPLATFVKALDEISASGGNTMRWWVHVNGRYSPTFRNGKVVGLSNEIAVIREVLDLALDRQMTICLTLWSFDMLQNQGQDQTAMRNMVQDTSYTRAYIRQALIPLVQALHAHPALLCWEICNEPEGMTNLFGWTPVRVTMGDVQRFVNLLTGAIHRTAPKALVTNGSWSFKASTDVAGYSNYYRDDRLIAAGGDSLGTLDFYQVHYYDWGGTALSPFHHSASYWQLDKPIVIGEFQADGPQEMTPLQAYQYAYTQGYAGAWSWTWTGHDNNGAIKEAAPGMTFLRDHFPSEIILTTPAGVITSFYADADTLIQGETVKIKWHTSSGSQVRLNGEPVAENDSLVLAPNLTTSYVLTAQGEFFNDTSRVRIEVLHPGDITSFNARPSYIKAGERVVLKWSSVRGTQLKLDGQTVAEEDSLIVYPPQTTTYTLIGSGQVADTAMVTVSVVQNRYNDDFENNVLDGWKADHPQTFALSEGNGVLTITYTRTASSWEWDNFNFTPPALLDLKAKPVIRLKVRSTISTTLTLKPIYQTGDDWLPKTIPGTNTWQTYTFTLTKAATPLNKIYLYLDGGTTATKSGVVQFDDLQLGMDPTAVDDEVPAVIPLNYSLGLAYPNPFNHATRMTFSTPTAEQTTLVIVDVLGRMVRRLYDGISAPGSHPLHWDGLDDEYRSVAGGVYFYRMETESGFKQTRKVLYLK